MSLVPLLLSVVLASSAFGIVSDPAKFSQQPHWNGLGACVKMVVVEASGEVFCGQKNGVISRYPSVTSGPGDATLVWDASNLAVTYGDKGLLGLAIDPDYPKTPLLWVLMSVNRLVNPADETAPLPVSNACPDGDDGDVASGRCDSSARLMRIRVAAGAGTLEQILAQDWCGNGFSHHLGNIAFASDNSMFLTAGDGSSFSIQDRGTPSSPCYRQGTAHVAQGAFRSQWDDFVHGKMLRITYADLNGNRLLTLGNGLTIIAKGLRNPFRFAIHPSSGDVFVGDVGSDFQEEINRVPNPLAATTVPNFGWPCFEGVMPHPWYGQDAFCKTTVGPTLAPWFRYSRNVPLTFANGGDGQNCMRGTVSPSAFAFRTGGIWGDQYQNALFWADSSMQCLMYFSNDAAGTPDPTRNNLVAYNSPTGTNAKWVDIVFAGANHADMYAVDYDQSGSWKFSALGVAPVPDGKTGAPVGAPPSGKTNTKTSGSSVKGSNQAMIWVMIAVCALAMGGVGIAGGHMYQSNNSTKATGDASAASTEPSIASEPVSRRLRQRRLRQRRPTEQSILAH